MKKDNAILYKKKVYVDKKNNIEMWSVSLSKKYSSKRTIKVTKPFFERYNQDEQIANIYHHEYTKKLSTLLKRYKNFLIYGNKKANFIEIFSADKYVSNIVNKKAMLSLLKKVKKHPYKGIFKEDLKNFPTINERIKRLEIY